MNLTTMGLDIAKNVFQIHGVDANGKVVLRKQPKRSQVLALFANLPPCRIGMEACAGAHYWARELIRLGHDARLISPQFVKPYVKGNKNDANDAEAICEAVSRPHMRFVPVKSIEQKDIQMLHRVRSGLVKAAAQKDDSQSRWINDLVQRRNGNIAAVAVANKNARIVWSLLTKSEVYNPVFRSVVK